MECIVQTDTDLGGRGDFKTLIYPLPDMYKAGTFDHFPDVMLLRQ